MGGYTYKEELSEKQKEALTKYYPVCPPNSIRDLLNFLPVEIMVNRWLSNVSFYAYIPCYLRVSKSTKHWYVSYISFHIPDEPNGVKAIETSAEELIDALFDMVIAVKKQGSTETMTFIVK